MFFRFADLRLADLKLHSNLRTTFGFWDSFDTEINGIHSLKYTYVGKKKYKRQPIEDLDQKHCFFPCKFADLRFADWDIKEICGFAIWGLVITNLWIAICGLAHLRNLRICGLTIKICVPTFDNALF
jgi:hypothetical protein